MTMGPGTSGSGVDRSSSASAPPDVGGLSFDGLSEVRDAVFADRDVTAMATVVGDVVEQSHRGQLGDQRRAAVGEEGQRDSRDRHQPTTDAMLINASTAIHVVMPTATSR